MSPDHCPECDEYLQRLNTLEAEQNRLREASNRVDRVWTVFFGVGLVPFGVTSKGWIADVHRAVVQLRAALDGEPTR